MVGTADISRIAAGLLQRAEESERVFELEGPERVSPRDVARTLSELLQRPVSAQAVRRDSWEPLFRSRGMKNPVPRMRMLDGFNEGWIQFEGDRETTLKGDLSLRDVLGMLTSTSE